LRLQQLLLQQLGGGGAAFSGALGAFPIPTVAGPTVSASSCSAFSAALSLRLLRPPLALPPPAPPPLASACSAPSAQPPCSASLGLRWWRPPCRTPARPAPSPLSLDSGDPRRGGRRRRAVGDPPRSGAGVRGGPPRSGAGTRIRLDLEQECGSGAVGRREAVATGEGGGGGESTPLQVSFTGLLVWIRRGRFLPSLSSTSS
jgi:hypothetical protein